ncbi:dipeptide ABC transporter ATP-binding protein [Mangrovibrevibacter kandeliae]|uniref:dipeptide ABC transporter ATP-binding protein n=1 Tax=Mangrovibrevibacter kandeliae TaxID=2968473 RepID=UPI0021177F8B|nr:dipeptide ABC transporter ATP-binding protein [Aurantimonas sp. CSK15Z-1]MCQ8780968.1 dipeptide ABC transporter ATP-binding protein [Aurantimonas sp. CSK15Z-1]
MSPIVIADKVGQTYSISRGAFRPTADLKAVQEASFEVSAGETLAIVGESGCGKSTLARMLTMIETPTSGTLTIDGIDVATAGAAELKRLRSTVQIVFQNPYGSLNPRQKVGAIIEEPLKINTDLSAAERRAKAEKLLAEVGLRPEHYNRYPHMFSGGQRQRIAVARAIALEPKILVLDEPVSALDVSIQAQILNLLADLQERLGLTYIFISHDLSVVRHVADRVMVMYLGRPIEIAPVETLYTDPQHPYTRALLAATPAARPGQRGERAKLVGELPSPFNPPKGCAFNPRCPFADERTRTERPTLKRHGKTMVACFAVEEGRLPPPSPREHAEA